MARPSAAARLAAPLSAGILALAPAVPPAAAEPASVWTMALTATPGDPRHAVADHFAACVRNASAGKLALVLDPDRAAAIRGNLAAGVLAGAPLLAAVSLADLPDPDPLFRLETIAELAPNHARADKLWTAARLDLDRLLAARGFALVFSTAAPPAGLFVATVPANRADLARLRLAAPTAAGARLMETLGLAPAPLAAPGDSVALAARLAPDAADRLDGFAAEPTAEAAAAASTGMTFLDLHPALPREVVVANRAAYEPLPADAKTALTACGDQAVAEGAAAARAADAAARAALQARGIAIAAPPAPLQADIAADGAARLSDWLAATGVAGKAIIDSYRAM